MKGAYIAILFIYCLFNEIVSISVFTALNGRMVTEKWIGKNWEGNGHGQIKSINPGICLVGVRDTMKNPCQNSNGLCWDLNYIPPEYRYKVLLLQWICLVMEVSDAPTNPQNPDTTRMGKQNSIYVPTGALHSQLIIISNISTNIALRGVINYIAHTPNHLQRHYTVSRHK
jgi:hypothetical protein